MNITDKTSALFKVTFDKIVDYVWHYASFSFLYETDVKDDTDFKNLFDVNEFADEKTHKRIRKDANKLGFFAGYSGFFNMPTHVVDNIYLGSAFNAASKDTLTKLNIKVVINVTKELSDYFPQEFEYYRCEIYDNNKQSISNRLALIHEYILRKQEELTNPNNSNVIYIGDDIDNNDNTEAKIEVHDISHDEIYEIDEVAKYSGNILIHCYMGASRSASIVIYYLMKTRNCTFEEALKYLIDKRPHVNPTFRFAKDLKNNEQK